MDTTLILYRKIFNNIFLKNKIYNYIKNIEEQSQEQEYDNEINDKIIYNSLINNYNVIDLNLYELLKKKQFKLLNNLIDNYFNFAIKDPIKYWYYIITPNEKEIKKLIEWPDLGLNKFKLLYKEFNLIFLKLNSKSSLIKHIIKSGNFEIYNYVINLQELAVSVSVSEFNIKWYNSQFEKFNCFGNLELFKIIMLNFKKNNLHYYNSYLIRILIKLSKRLFNVTFEKDDDFNINEPYSMWLKEGIPLSSSFQYYEIYKFILNECADENQIFRNYKQLVYTCLLHNDLSLARVIVEFTNQYNRNNGGTGTTPIGSKMYFFEEFINFYWKISKLIIPNGSINVLNYIIDNLDDDDDNDEGTALKVENVLTFISKSELYKNFEIYGFIVLDGTTHNNDNLLLKSIQKGYIPNSLIEFNYIMSKEILKINFTNKSNLSIFQHIANQLIDFEYLKHFCKIVNFNFQSILESNGNFTNRLLNSSFEIMVWIFNQIEKEREGKVITINIEHIHSFRIDDSKFFKWLKSNYNKNINFLINKEIIRRLIFDNHNNIINHDDLIEFIFNEKLSELNLYDLNQIIKSLINFNRFNIFKNILYSIINSNNQYLSTIIKELIQFSKSNKIHPILNSILLKIISTQTQPQEQQEVVHVMFSPKLKQEEEEEEEPSNIRNSILNSIYINNNNNNQNSSLIKFINLNNTKIFEKLEINSILDLFGNGSDSKLLNETISILIKTNLKKFIYLLEFDKKLSNSKFLINNFKIIIQKSILLNNLIILKYIIKNYENHDNNLEFIYQFKLYILYYSILYSNRKITTISKSNIDFIINNNNNNNNVDGDIIREFKLLFEKESIKISLISQYINLIKFDYYNNNNVIIDDHQYNKILNFLRVLCNVKNNTLSAIADQKEKK